MHECLCASIATFSSLCFQRLGRPVFGQRHLIVENQVLIRSLFVDSVQRLYCPRPTGLPFPEKVETWLELNPGDRFTAFNEGSEGTDHEIQSSWQELEARKMVVSNLVPSYVKKETVEFRTDMELLEMVEDEDRVYSVEC